ncbi:MAG: FGGY family carbohydrate kinase, partial [Anaerolineales bacterium]
MGPKIISFDLGTGGNKATLYDTAGNCLASAFVPYPTLYPEVGRHEQRPADWWAAVVESSRQLMESSGLSQNDVHCLGISGHSLGAVPLDEGGTVLRESTPIWSDLRAGAEAEKFFERVDRAAWYAMTGNGFPAALYTVFKIMWYRDHEPEMFGRVRTILGTKDYINYRLTGKIATDYSYASGSGVYDLRGGKYADDLIQASGVPRAMLPEIIPSSEVSGGARVRVVG